ncbi:MAG: aminoacyl-tRNA hydrolase, partial [Candidatus Hydrogenedentota bacterium]
MSIKLVIGLGNPGPQYRNTRHNVGFQVLDQLAEELGVSFSREKFKGQIAEARVNRQKLLLLKPMT